MWNLKKKRCKWTYLQNRLSYGSQTLAVNLWFGTLSSVFWNSKITAAPFIEVVGAILRGVCCVLCENGGPCSKAGCLCLIKMCSTSYQIRALGFQWLHGYWIVSLQRNPGKTAEINNENYHPRAERTWAFKIPEVPRSSWHLDTC